MLSFVKHDTSVDWQLCGKEISDGRSQEYWSASLARFAIGVCVFPHVNFLCVGRPKAHVGLRWRVSEVTFAGKSLLVVICRPAFSTPMNIGDIFLPPSFWVIMVWLLRFWLTCRQTRTFDTLIIYNRPNFKFVRQILIGPNTMFWSYGMW